MNLFFLRHGIAVERDPKSFPDDSRRPLTLKGEDRIRLVCDAIRGLDISFDQILSSPFLRSRQTADIVASELNLRNILCFRDELKPGGDFKALIRRINLLRPAPENILLVGHEPDLSHLISQLISGQGEVLVDLKKGGFAKLEIAERLRPTRCATLIWLLTPKQTALMVNSR
jgi:phosphohistidine phosphatase